MRRVFQRVLRAYGLRFSEREYLGYYTLDSVWRELLGLYPATHSELALCLLHASVVIFREPDMDGVLDWLELLPDYYSDMDASAWGKVVNGVRRRIQEELD